MKGLGYTRTGSLFLTTAMWGLFATCMMGEVKTFTIDPTQSSLTIGGSFLGFQMTQQGPGSLTTTYTGTIKADVTATTIQFVGGSMIVAQNSGNWQPSTNGVAGTAPANYGGSISGFGASGKAALRELLLDATSGVLTLTAGSFPAQGMVFNFPSNAPSAVDYNYTSPLGSGSARKALAGASTNNIVVSGSLSNVAAETVLTIPADLLNSATIISPNDLQYRLQGQLVARASSAAVLSISSFSITPGQLNFTITTVPGLHYTILGSTDMVTWPTIIDQFTANGTSTTRNIPLPPAPNQYFRIRQD